LNQLSGFDWGNGEWSVPPSNRRQNGNLVIGPTSSPTPRRSRSQLVPALGPPQTKGKRSWTFGGSRPDRHPQCDRDVAAFWMMGDACDDSSTATSTPFVALRRDGVQLVELWRVDIMEHRNSETVSSRTYSGTWVVCFPWPTA